MKRSERGALIVAALLYGGLTLLILRWSGTFANSPYSKGGSNLLGIILAPPAITALAITAWVRWSRQCRATRWCLRLGEHPVAGTTKKVCEHHHTLKDHRHVYDLHHIEGKLGWGESHDRTLPPSTGP